MPYEFQVICVVCLSASTMQCQLLDLYLEKSSLQCEIFILRASPSGWELCDSYFISFFFILKIQFCVGWDREDQVWLGRRVLEPGILSASCLQNTCVIARWFFALLIPSKTLLNVSWRRARGYHWLGWVSENKPSLISSATCSG